MGSIVSVLGGDTVGSQKKNAMQGPVPAGCGDGAGLPELSFPRWGSSPSRDWPGLSVWPLWSGLLPQQWPWKPPEDSCKGREEQAGLGGSPSAAQTPRLGPCSTPEGVTRLTLTGLPPAPPPSPGHRSLSPSPCPEVLSGVSLQAELASRGCPGFSGRRVQSPLSPGARPGPLCTGPSALSGQTPEGYMECTCTF